MKYLLIVIPYSHLASALECNNEENAVCGWWWKMTAKCRSVVFSGLEYGRFAFCPLQLPFPSRFLRNDESNFAVACVRSQTSFEWFSFFFGFFFYVLHRRLICMGTSKAEMVHGFMALAIYALVMKWKWIFDDILWSSFWGA